MKSELEKAMAKIQKCLRLADSTNPHEAAQALKQAYALMRKHNINESVATDCADITTGNSLDATNTRKIAAWVACLVNVIEDVFSVVTTCESSADINYCGSRIVFKTTVKFYGEQSDVAISEYAFAFLLRLLRKSRSKYYAELSPSKRNRTKLADNYALGWCQGVHGAIKDLRRFDEAEYKKQRDKIGNYIGALHGKLDKAKTTKINTVDMSARIAGFYDGQAVEINRGVNTAEKIYLDNNNET